MELERKETSSSLKGEVDAEEPRDVHFGSLGERTFLKVEASLVGLEGTGRVGAIKGMVRAPPSDGDGAAGVAGGPAAANSAGERADAAEEYRPA